MNLNTRSIGLALLLLLLFLGTALALQWWLNRETLQLNTTAVAEAKRQLARALKVSERPPEKWDDAFQLELGAMLGGAVELYPTGSPPPSRPRRESVLSFTEEIPSRPGWQARVFFAPSALIRVQVLHQRVMAAIVLLALLLGLVPLLVVILESRQSLPPGTTRTPWAATRAQAVGMEHFARISNERGAALEQEHGARLRAEEDLLTNRGLLSSAQEERARLGRDLHDNICQTLYAVGLTLDSVRKKISATPEIWQRLEQSIAELRRLNQEVRAYLRQLEPDEIRRQSFHEAVGLMLDILPADAGLQVHRQFDEEAVALIRPHQAAEVVNILREAISNAARHGHARHITLRAERDETTLAVAVQDDGTGFPAGSPSRGHGLANMEARAMALGGTLRVESNTGKGTRVLLTIPVASPR